MKNPPILLRKFTRILPVMISPLLMMGWQLANATVVVDWGGAMVSENVNLALPTPSDNGGTRTWKWDTDSPSISPNSGYTGQAFYGAFQNTSGDNLGPARITNSGTADFLEIRGNSATATVSGLIFFQPDVVNSIVSFDASSSLSAVVQYLNYNPRSVRFAVLNDGTWYLSSYWVSGATTLNIADASAAMWGEWDITDAAPLPATPASFTTAGSTFDDIQGLGIYFSTYGNEASAPGRFEFSSFTANAVVTVIPEPSTALLLVLATGLIKFSRRYHHKD